MAELYKIDKTTELGSVTLNVENLTNMCTYYEEVIGLDVLNQSDKRVELGTEENQKVLLTLVKEEVQGTPTKKAGLFHTAFLLPSRKDLGNVLYSYLSREIPIGGASDHGYSEALYLQDPEGNDIEIYADKPKEEWDIQPDGTIPGITIQMDANGVIESRDEGQIDKFPAGTVIGHVHLSVSNLEATHEFYVDVLGLDLKYNYGDQAKFLAAGEYHHHVGANTWAGENVPKREETDLGLRSYSFVVPNDQALKNVEANLEKLDMQFTEEVSGAISLFDPNGVKVIVEAASQK